jgi:hypothetical protein
VRCKHCGTIVPGRPKAAPAASPEPAPNAPAAARRDYPVAKPAPEEPARQPDEDVPVAASAQPFATGEDEPIVRLSLRYRRSRTGRWIVFLGLLSSVAVIAGGAYVFREPLSRLATSLREFVAENGAEGDKGTADAHAAAGQAFPRRALVICVDNYLYANPVSYTVQAHNVHALTDKLRRVLHIEPSQFVELSDAALAPPDKSEAQSSGKKTAKAKGKSAPPSTAPSPARPPLKPVIEKTIADFLTTCRAQDRILLMFIGHVVEVEGEAYLVPLEGEFKVKESLIPLSWLYEQLKKCPARQKVLVVDTCRHDPGRGAERPGSGPMPAKLDAVLAKPPEGVQLWSACTAEQYSYELDGDSIFLEKLHASLTQKVIGKMQREEDPLPVEALAESVAKSTSAEVASQLKAKQTPRLVGKEAEGGAAFDPQEALPAKIEIPMPPPPPGGTAGRAEVHSILSEIDLPPIKMSGSDTALLQIETLVPFSAKKLAAYQRDYSSLQEIEANAEKYPLRVAVLDAIKRLRERFNPKNPELVLRDYFSGNSSDSIKKEILKEQEKPADVLIELNGIKTRLEKLADERDGETSKRWQAHYDFILAQVLARIAYLEEYSLMLGKIRKDELPALEPGHTGYRLASRERLQSGTEVRALATASKKLLAKVARQNKGTPWEILAKREQLTALGLEWQPTR